MPLPRVDLRGKRATITMMELRAGPGEVMDRVKDGLVIDVEKAGKRIAVIARDDQDTTTIHRDGSIEGAIPFTFRRNLGEGGY
jgi:hypothetical protein